MLFCSHPSQKINKYCIKVISNYLVANFRCTLLVRSGVVDYCDLSVKIKQMFNRNYLHVILRLLFFGYLLFSLSLFLFLYEPCFTYQNWRFWCYDFEIQLEHFEDSIWRFSLAIQIFNGSALVYVSRRKKIF